MPRISVIIPSWNEARTLPVLFGSLRRQTVQDFEVILADSGSTDDTLRVAASFGVRWSVGERKGPAEGRNRGARLARAEVLVFVDADCVLPPDVLEHLLTALADREVIGGATLFHPMEGTRPERLLFFLANAYQRATIAWGWPHNAGFCFFFRRNAFEQLGGMREDLLLNETHDIALRSRELGRFVSLSDVVDTSMRRFRGNGFAQTVLHEYLGSTLLYYVTGRQPTAVFRPEPVR
jgi:glycosyltransferase involved in cell wall biosynthesis